MWLDKFSSSTVPSTLPRERSLLSGSGWRSTPTDVGPPNAASIGLTRANSYDIASSSNASTTSLPLPQRRPNGSSLRQEHRQAQDVKNPLTVLEELLGKQTAKQNGKHEIGISEKEVFEIEFEGLSLQQYASTHIGRARHDLLGSVAPDGPATTRLEYESFHSSVIDIDDVLSSVEKYLTNFKTELGQVSAEIEDLQSRSLLLTSQLDNRRKVERVLGPSVEAVSVSPVTVYAIAEGPINDTFAKALTEVEARHLNVIGRDQTLADTKAAEDIRPLLEDLKARAVERIRDYLVAQIKALRSPNINAQVIQQQTFLRHKELFPFLSRNHPLLAEEITQAYTNTLHWYYTSNFTRYNTALSKMQLHQIDQNELLGVDPSTKRSNTKSPIAQYDAFALGQRGNFLKYRDERALPSHILEDTKATHYIEAPFRNFNQVLLDNLTAEYTASTELFSTNTYQQVSKRVISMFDSVFTMGQNLTKQLVENTTDCIGILLCIRLNQVLAFEAQKRRLPVMDDYINYTSILLWPKLQKSMDMHCESLKKVTATTSRGAATAFSLVGGNDASKASVAPHAITQRFGQFLHAILTISADAGDEEPVANSLSRLCAEFNTVINKLAKNAGDSVKRGRFIYNNYSLVLTIIGDASGKLAEDQKEHFSALIRDLKPR